MWFWVYGFARESLSFGLDQWFLVRSGSIETIDFCNGRSEVDFSSSLLFFIAVTVTPRYALFKASTPACPKLAMYPFNSRFICPTCMTVMRLQVKFNRMIPRRDSELFFMEANPWTLQVIITVNWRREKFSKRGWSSSRRLPAEAITNWGGIFISTWSVVADSKYRLTGYGCLFLSQRFNVFFLKLVRRPSQENLIAWARCVQPCSTAGPNAYNQNGPRARAACVKLCGLDNSLATHRRLTIPFKNRNACLWNNRAWIKCIPGAGELAWSKGKINSKLFFS